MAVFCSTVFDYKEFDNIKNSGDTVGIVGIKNSTPTVIFWKNKIEDENVDENSYTHFFQITSHVSNDDDSNSNNGSVDSVSSIDNVSSVGGVVSDAYKTLIITNDDDYLQVQNSAKCAIHSLNNLLKGEYFTTVDITNDERDIIEFPMPEINNPERIDNVKQKLDLLKQKYYETNGKAGVNLFAVGTVLKQYASLYFDRICDAKPGNSYGTAIISIALNMFGYHTNTITPADKMNNDIFNALNNAKDNFTGIILNTSTSNTGRGGHFIAIRRVNDTNDFVLVDSHKKLPRGTSPMAIKSDVIPLNNETETNNFISNWLSVNTHYQYISNPGYLVTNDNDEANKHFNQIIADAYSSSTPPTYGGRKSSKKNHRGRSASIAHSGNLVVHQRYKTKRRKSPYTTRTLSKPRRNSSTRKRR